MRRAGVRRHTQVVVLCGGETLIKPPSGRHTSALHGGATLCTRVWSTAKPQDQLRRGADGSSPCGANTQAIPCSRTNFTIRSVQDWPASLEMSSSSPSATSKCGFTGYSGETTMALTASATLEAFLRADVS